MSDPLQRFRDAAELRAFNGVTRRLRPRPAGGDGLVDLASNDYLGLSRDPRVVSAAATAALVWGAGSTGSRLVTGTTALHADLEEGLAAFLGAPEALVFSSGYLANLAAVGTLGGPGVLVVSDQGNHASLIDACRLSRSRLVVVGHRDVNAVERALSTRQEEHALVVTDAVFSVDGDLAPLPALHAVTRRFSALLIVDEAHSLGVVGEGGRGAVHAVGLGREPDIIRTLTLSKSLGAQGGAVVAQRRDHLHADRHGPPVHLRHRAGAVVGRRGAGRAGRPGQHPRPGPRRCGPRPTSWRGSRARPGSPRHDRTPPCWPCPSAIRTPRARPEGLRRQRGEGWLLPAAGGAERPLLYPDDRPRRPQRGAPVTGGARSARGSAGPRQQRALAHVS